MPETLTLKDGTFTTLFPERDFEELVDKYMGPEAARYFRALMDDAESKVKAAEDRLAVRTERLRIYANEL